ncbi:MAG: hypothetical protein COA91_13505 [Robiginitomaculum sp.]|nr:MAG: hypothetical protein COA91_13505 [Robiginitomaculum sp.]
MNITKKLVISTALGAACLTISLPAAAQDSDVAMASYLACTQSTVPIPKLRLCQNSYDALMKVVTTTKNKKLENLFLENAVMAAYIALLQQKSIDMYGGRSGPSENACVLAKQGLAANFRLEKKPSEDDELFYGAIRELVVTKRKCREQNQELVVAPPKKTDAEILLENQQLCFSNSSKANLDDRLAGCDGLFSHFRGLAEAERRRLSAITGNEKTNTSYKDHDNYTFKSGGAAFQSARFQNSKTPDNQKLLCPHLHKAMQQFKKLHVPPARGSEPWKIIGMTKNMVDSCKAGGL